MPAATEMTVGRVAVRLSNTGKLPFPDDGITGEAIVQKHRAEERVPEFPRLGEPG